MLARCWPPYPKWLGAMLARLPVGAALAPVLTALMTSEEWSRRQDAVRELLADPARRVRVARSVLGT